MPWRERFKLSLRNCIQGSFQYFLLSQDWHEESIMEMLQVMARRKYCGNTAVVVGMRKVL